MIDILKKQIEQKIGTEITSRGDCEMISNAILQTLDVSISYNTIRRLFGLASHTKPNKKTLDINYNFGKIKFIDNLNTFYGIIDNNDIKNYNGIMIKNNDILIIINLLNYINLTLSIKDIFNNYYIHLIILVHCLYKLFIMFMV